MDDNKKREEYYFSKDTTGFEWEKEKKEKKEISLEQAREILGKDFYGPEQVKNATGIEIPKEMIPEINLSREELETLKENGCELFLDVGKDNEGNPITAERFLEIMAGRMGKGNKLIEEQKEAGSAELNKYCELEKEDFFTNESLKTEWRVVSEEYSPETGYENHVEQIRIVRDHLVKLGVLSDEEIKECSDTKLDKLQKLIDKGKYRKLTEKMSEIGIVKRCELSYVETIWTGALRFKINNDRGILEKKYTRTRDVSSDGYRVSLGNFNSNGFHALHYWDVYSDPHLFLISSWSL